MRLGQHSPSRQQNSPHRQGLRNRLGRVRVRTLLLGAALLALLVFYVLTCPAGDGKGGKDKGSTPHVESLQTILASGAAKESQSSLAFGAGDMVDKQAQYFTTELRRSRSTQLGSELKRQSAGSTLVQQSLHLQAVPKQSSEQREGGLHRLEEAVHGRVPTDFDWQTYLMYYPELQEQGVKTESLAKDHYASIGRGEGRVYRRLRVLLRYTACTGLINQHYSHIAAFSLSAVLGAELVLPPAAKRDSFAHYFSVFKEQNEVSWTAAPLESLLDVDRIISEWSTRGLVIHRTPALEPFPDLTQPETAYAQYQQPGIDTALRATLGSVYLQHLDMSELVDRARQAVIEQASKLLRKDPGVRIEYIVLDLPCTFFMLKTLSKLPLVTEVARSMHFSPALEALADRIIASMTARGGSEYNAVHLRIEKDARDWSTIMGGEAVVWQNYVQAMRQANFQAGSDLYIASGLLTYGANDEMMHLIDTLKELGLCKSAHYKELHLPQREIDALNSEQKALLDFLVLGRGRSFVGFGSSTFSFYLREHRLLQGRARSTTVLVDSSVIGTDPLFSSAGIVI